VFGVNIVVENPLDSTTIAFGFTNDSGQFEIEFNSELDSVFLTINAMTIQKKNVFFPLVESLLSLKLQVLHWILRKTLLEVLRIL
jgi:hypothetical protein